ncbi:MAG: DUF2383 domain-containing protein [Caldilineaceae bacterium]
MTSINRQELRAALQELYNACRISEEDLHAASEQMQNRGLKGLFKRFAQQHSRFAQQQEDLAQQIGFTLAPAGRFRNSLQRGWMDIRIAMIVGRTNRQAAAAAKSDESEGNLLERYNQALQLPLPEFAMSELKRQREWVQRIHEWLQRVVARDEWIVRLYDDSTEAEQAVEELSGSGFTDKQIMVTPIHQITQYQADAEERVHSTVDATLVGALIGAVLGALFGLFAGYISPGMSPVAVLPQTAPLWASTLFSGAIGLLVGGSFGSLFGFLLGRGIAEDDASLVRYRPGQDAIVVSVQTTKDNHTRAAQILQMWHQREVGNVPA